MERLEILAVIVNVIAIAAVIVVVKIQDVIAVAMTILVVVVNNDKIVFKQARLFVSCLLNNKGSMKESFYNIYSSIGDNVISFNTKENSFVVMPIKYYTLIKSGKFEEIPQNYLHQLIQEHYILQNDDEDEKEDLIMEYRESISENNSMYHLTILPTLDCNLRCWYCFDQHIKSHLEQKMRENTLQLVDNILNRPEIRVLKVTMFGGEPLLYFETEVYPLLHIINKRASEKRKKVFFNFVTNATCIRENWLPLFAELKATFQISIDGYGNKHNQIKKDVNNVEPTYEKVIRIVHLLCDAYEDIHVLLRINYDNQTLNHISEVIEDISDIERRKISLHLERVWQTKAQFSSGVTVKDAIRLILGNGFNVTYMNFSRRGYSCISSKENQIVVSYDGSIYKCTGRDFTPRLKEGTLLERGLVEWDKEKHNERMRIETFQNAECISCKMLPLCWGPCNQKQLEQPNNMQGVCQLRGMEISLSDYVYFAFNNDMLYNQIHKKE